MAKDENLWRCGECGATTEYKATYVGDFPDGWWGVEDKSCSWVICSVKCLRAFSCGVEELQPAEAVSDQEPQSSERTENC